MLEFSISNQLLSRLDATQVMSDSENYLECSFQFSSDWDNTVAVATFGHSQVSDPISVRIVDGKCRVPHEVIKTYGFQVSVYGTVEEDEGTVCHIPTNTVTVDVEASGVGSGLAPAEPTQDMYDTLMSSLALTEAEALEAKISAKSSAGIAMGAQRGAERAVTSAMVSAATSAAEAKSAQASHEAVKVARRKMDALTELNKSYVLGSGEDEQVAHITGITWDSDDSCQMAQLDLAPGRRYRVKVNGVWRDVAAQWVLEEREEVTTDDNQAELFSLNSRVYDDEPIPEIPMGEEVINPGGDGGDGWNVAAPATPVTYEVVKDIVKLVAGPVTIEDVVVDNATGEENVCRLTTTDRSVTEVEIWTDGNDNAKYFYEKALAAAERAEAAALRAEARG